MPAVLTDRDGLLSAILAEPDDDAPRLLYADWLDDAGEGELAELIRVQCELARLESKEGGHHPNMLNHPGSDYRTGMCVLCDRATELGRRSLDLFAAFVAEDMACYFGLPNHESMHPTATGLIAPALGIELVLTRGFVSAVRGSLAELIGGHCPGCDGTGRHLTYQTVQCLRCSGTGRTAGVLAGVAKGHPVEVVRATCRTPRYLNAALQVGWTWSKHETGEPDDVPEVWDLIDCPSHSGGWFKYFPTADAAHAALSTALLAHARGA